MKSLKLIISILAILIALFMFFQTFAVGIVNALDKNTADTSGGAGQLLAIVYLVCGISGIVVRGSRAGSIIVGIIYFLGAFVGFANRGTYGDLVVWAAIAAIFGLIFLISFDALDAEKVKKEIENQ